MHEDDFDRRLEVRRERDRVQDLLVDRVTDIEARLGRNNTTLMADLDHRYMPREDLKKEFIPRAEHEAGRRQETGARLHIAVVLFGGISCLSTLLLAVHQVTH